jgi:hypothetical protein
MYSLFLPSISFISPLILPPLLSSFSLLSSPHSPSSPLLIPSYSPAPLSSLSSSSYPPPLFLSAPLVSLFSISTNRTYRHSRTPCIGIVYPVDSESEGARQGSERGIDRGERSGEEREVEDINRKET